MNPSPQSAEERRVEPTGATCVAVVRLKAADPLGGPETVDAVGNLSQVMSWDYLVSCRAAGKVIKALDVSVTFNMVTIHR